MLQIADSHQGKMLNDAAFLLGLRCLPKYPFGVSSMGWSIVYIERLQVIISFKSIVIFL